MDIKKLLLLSLIVSLVQVESYFAQSSGYVGKKNFIEANFGGSLMVIPSLLSFNGEFYTYDKKRNSLDRDDRLFRSRTNWSFGFSRLLSKNTMIGLAFRTTSFLVPQLGPYESTYLTSNQWSSDYEYFYATSPTVRVNTFKFVYTFCTKTSILPVGINHSISAGPKFSNIVTNKDYYYEMAKENSNGNIKNEVARINAAPNDFKNSNLGFEISYINTLRYAVHKNLIFNFGIEMRLAITQSNISQRSEMKNKFSGQNDYEVSMNFYNKNYSEYTRKEDINNFFNVFVGVTVPF